MTTNNRAGNNFFYKLVLWLKHVISIMKESKILNIILWHPMKFLFNPVILMTLWCILMILLFIGAPNVFLSALFTM